MSYTVPPTRTAAVVRQLRNEIVTGELPPGTLIKDAELAGRLGVSITPVREAIAQLSVEGLIDIAPNRTRHVTKVTQQNALELIDVMRVLACAGFEWGVHSLTETHIDLMRQRQKEFVESVRTGNVLAAGEAGADFSTIVIQASGNRELQAMLDLVVARTTRILAGSVDGLWHTWVTGHDDILRLLDAGDTAGALERYRQIFVDHRAEVERVLLDE
ncbi:GntR family transcriptional regulator [Amorphoplanes digitatis]|uniref:DNA-binding GntR family transcriptional regulator n=1 Tax=Actinoplanes digitatis TaxID=1868 RepID=A0A7W7MTG1_9ACTN|nr:GntR family transcriptional regulator [Actinoplanes digitatis]MBB4766283.1 DNA-binding GntR family transcriptional regulator [Actinoplanes digitatis]GID95944.1 GntR family transcriptional regulator [Actinoplanes digitatis]